MSWNRWKLIRLSESSENAYYRSFREIQHFKEHEIDLETLTLC